MPDGGEEATAKFTHTHSRHSRDVPAVLCNITVQAAGLTQERSNTVLSKICLLTQLRINFKDYFKNMCANLLPSEGLSTMCSYNQG